MKTILKNTKYIEQVICEDVVDDESWGYRDRYCRYLDPSRVKWNIFKRIFGANDLNADVKKAGVYEVKSTGVFSNEFTLLDEKNLPSNLVLIDNVVHMKRKVIIQYSGTRMRDDVFFFDTIQEQESWLSYFKNKYQHIKIITRETLQ